MFMITLRTGETMQKVLFLSEQYKPKAVRQIITKFYRRFNKISDEIVGSLALQLQ